MHHKTRREAVDEVRGRSKSGQSMCRSSLGRGYKEESIRASRIAECLSFCLLPLIVYFSWYYTVEIMVSTKQLLLQLASALSIVEAAVIHHRVDDVDNSSPVIDLGYAKYRGVRLDAGVDQFLGMRFAQAPLGHLRFRAPQDPTPEKDIQDASAVSFILFKIYRVFKTSF